MDDNNQPITNVGQSTWQYLGQHWLFTVAYAVVAIACVIVGFIGKLPALAALSLLVLIVGYSVARSKMQTAFMRQFADANGYSFSPNATMEGLNGAFFRIGHGQRRYDLVSGSYQNHPIELFLYQYTIGYGKGSRTYVYTVFRLKFDTEMPDLVLEQKEYSVDNSILKTAGAQKEFVSLEGDFNKYFSLSVPKGYEVEALEVFTPDVMTELIEKCKALNLEITGTDLFIYSPGAVGKENRLLDLYSIALYFGGELGPVLARMKPSLVAEQHVMQE
jgi:hypothetical protein